MLTNEIIKSMDAFKGLSTEKKKKKNFKEYRF